MKICYLMIGLPGSGKSTWIENFLKDNSDFQVISPDFFIEEFAKKNNKKYNEVFREVSDDALKKAKAFLRESLNLNLPIIWDQTNLTEKTRIKKVKQLKDKKYKVIAVTFVLSDEEWKKRIQTRKDSGGKHLSYKTIMNMKEMFVLPTYKEGFDEIYIIDDKNIQILLQNNCFKMGNT